MRLVDIFTDKYFSFAFIGKYLCLLTPYRNESIYYILALQQKPETTLVLCLCHLIEIVLCDVATLQCLLIFYLQYALRGQVEKFVNRKIKKKFFYCSTLCHIYHCRLWYSTVNHMSITKNYKTIKSSVQCTYPIMDYRIA